MSRPLLFVIIALTLAAASLRAADDAAAVFDSLYGRKLQSVSATPTSADDVAFAAELLDAANKATEQPALLETLCDHAYTLGSKDAAGFKTAVQALSLLATYIEARHTDALEKTAALEQRRFATAKPADKPTIAASLAQTLIELAESQRDQGDTTTALKLYQRAAVAIGSFDPAVRQHIQSAVDDITRRQKLLDLQHTLEAALKANPADTKAAAKLARYFIVDRDDPAAALEPARAAADPALLNNVTHAVAEPSTLTPDQLSDLGDWYRGLSDEGDAAAKPTMLERARGYYRALLDADGAGDLAKKKAELALDFINTALASMGTQSPPNAPARSTGKAPLVSKRDGQFAEVKVTQCSPTPGAPPWGLLRPGEKMVANADYSWTEVSPSLLGRRFTVPSLEKRNAYGILEFEVTTRGMVLIAFNKLASDGRTARREDLIAAGWKEEQGLTVQGKKTNMLFFFSRECKPGEKFKYRSGTTFAPILIK